MQLTCSSAPWKVSLGDWKDFSFVVGEAQQTVPSVVLSFFVSDKVVVVFLQSCPMKR